MVSSMADRTPIVTWRFLAIDCSPSLLSYASSPSPPLRQSFAQALNNACDIPLSQLSIPCLKGDAIAVQIPEDEYQACLESCKTTYMADCFYLRVIHL